MALELRVLGVRGQTASGRTVVDTPSHVHGGATNGAIGFRTAQFVARFIERSVSKTVGYGINGIVQMAVDQVPRMDGNGVCPPPTGDRTN
jgi:hypothetical protein